jgi:predicted ribonuclease YlaK
MTRSKNNSGTNTNKSYPAKKKNRRNKRTKQEERVDRGNEQLLADARKKQFDNDWKLDWFEPVGKQVDVVDAIKDPLRTFVIVDGSSGVGKTTAALHTALCGLKDGSYRQLIFIKNPTEVGDDKIGFLSGSEQDKLEAHYATTKRIFNEFMLPQKLENDMSSGKIRLEIPNFVLGATFDNAIVILDESQLKSENTMKLLLERCGVNTKYVILGDSKQKYAISKRVDGFRNLIERVTEEYYDDRISISEMVSYIRLNYEENRRSEGSKFITALYEENEIIA